MRCFAHALFTIFTEEYWALHENVSYIFLVLAQNGEGGGWLVTHSTTPGSALLYTVYSLPLIQNITDLTVHVVKYWPFTVDSRSEYLCQKYLTEDYVSILAIF